MEEKYLESQPRILIVDDEEGARESLELILEDHYQIECVENGFLALERIRRASFDLVLLDITMPKMDGIEILKKIKEYNETIDVIMVSAADRAHEATVSMKCGAFDYITKPYEPEQILSTVDIALRKRCLLQQVRRPCPDEVFRIGNVRIVSQSESMHRIFQMIEKVAGTASNVLITGESGTGKELIARAIHAGSPRAQKPFVALNCAAIPPELMESELFGYEKGAFTGAHARNRGKFEFAHGGSVFLDEISSLRLELQAKLLRVLQEREVTRVGGHQTLKVDVRIIAATNTNLEQMVEQNKFRSDLFFRLNVIPIDLPPLRERKGDIPLLLSYFLPRFNKLLAKEVFGISPDAMNVLEAYPWPGNVRELENLIERLVVLGPDSGWIEESDLPFDLLIRSDAKEPLDEKERKDLGLIQAREAFERQYILRALKRCSWRPSETARLLKIHRNTLMQKIKSLKL